MIPPECQGMSGGGQANSRETTGQVTEHAAASTTNFLPVGPATEAKLKGSASGAERLPAGGCAQGDPQPLPPLFEAANKPTPAWRFEGPDPTLQLGSPSGRSGQPHLQPRAEGVPRVSCPRCERN